MIYKISSFILVFLAFFRSNAKNSTPQSLITLYFIFLFLNTNLNP